jgi:hypothetical protein
VSGANSHRVLSVSVGRGLTWRPGVVLGDVLRTGVPHLSVVSQLLSLGIDPDECVVSSDDGSKSWGAPLWFATMCGRHEIAKTLLDHGADVNAIIFACGDAMSIARSTTDERLQTSGYRRAVTDATD